MLITSGLLGVLIGYGAAMKTLSQGTWQVLIRNFTMITASKQWKKKCSFIDPSAEIQPYCAILEFFLLYVGDVISSDLSTTFDVIVQF